MNDKYARRSLVLTGLALPLGLFVGKAVELVLKTLNPAHIDISGVLAYLAPIILSTIFTVTICWLAAVGCAFMSYKRGEDKKNVKRAGLVLLLVIFLTMCSLIFIKQINKKVYYMKQHELEITKTPK
jgi:hypothetical protein